MLRDPSLAAATLPPSPPQLSSVPVPSFCLLGTQGSHALSPGWSSSSPVSSPFPLWFLLFLRPLQLQELHSDVCSHPPAPFPAQHNYHFKATALCLFTGKNCAFPSHGEKVPGGRCATRKHLKSCTLKAVTAHGERRQLEKTHRFSPSMVLQRVGACLLHSAQQKKNVCKIKENKIL